MHNNQSSLVSTEWLAEQLGTPGIVVLDGGFQMPGAPTTAAADYAAGHIPGASFFDIEVLSDLSSPLPHMLPQPKSFAEAMGALGISNEDLVVVYDGPGLISAGRVWWMFRVFGHDKVVVLDGGLKKWQAEGREVTTVVPRPPRKSFVARYRPELLRSRTDMLANLQTHAEQVIDARSARRFGALDPEPRPGLRGGHIPGSFNLPFALLTNAQTGELKPDAEIRTLFQSAGLDLDKPVIASCGSGVTSAALLFALHVAGKDDVTTYDGSWSEWGLPGDTPVETG
ncbi:MAG: 3-mercaptopyruvate sulfurtransferase [Devosia sp.]